jgi:hypothetical protein
MFVTGFCFQTDRFLVLGMTCEIYMRIDVEVRWQCTYFEASYSNIAIEDFIALSHKL